MANTRITLSLFLCFCTHLVLGQFSYEHRLNMRDDNVSVYKLVKSGSTYGHATFLWRGKSNGTLKAKYFASGNTYEAFKSWKGQKDIVLLSSGAYSNGFSYNSIPIGLCVDNGRIVNRKIEDDKDALVIVEAVGGVRVSDIDLCDLTLASLNRTICPRRDKTTLLSWGEDEYATIFQTHLLAFKNTLRISSYNSDKSSATRRFLVLGFIEGSLFHAVFDITRSMSLYDAASDVLNSLGGANVIAVLNLDTGGNNIYESYNDYGSKISYLEGTKTPANATNLLVYYYDN